MIKQTPFKKRVTNILKSFKMRTEVSFQIFQLVARQQRLCVAIIFKKNWKFYFLFPRGKQLDEDADCSRCKHAINPDHLGPSACSPIPLRFLSQAVIGDYSHAAQAGHAWQRHRDLTSYREAVSDLMYIHSNIYVRDKMPSG